ncbi:MAG: type IV pilus secretin PilQ [Desulfohalobiaceae bacterium]|nr:type IV pilus secretin PilQ [Desulfohalobiaceae bacterium]
MDDRLSTLRPPTRDRCQPFLFICLLFLGLTAAACAQGQSSLSENKALTGRPPADQSLDGPGPRAALSDPFASPNQESGIRVDQDRKKTVLSIPVSAETRVSPSYDHPLLRLSFSPSIPRVSLPGKETGSLLAGIEPFPGDEKEQGIAGLDINVKKKVRFLVTRPSQDLINLLLVPVAKKAPTISRQERIDAKEQESAGLTDIRFNKDEQENQLITLTTSRPVQYKILPSTENNIKILFPGLNIPPEFEKLYRLHTFRTQVESVLLHSGPRGGLLLLKNHSRSPVHIKRNDNSLTLLIASKDGQGQDLPQPARPGRAGPAEAEKPPAAAGNKNMRDLLPESRAAPAEDAEAAAEYSGEPISIDLQGAEVEHVLRLLATVGGYNLVLDQQVQGRISLKLDHVPWDQALDIVLKQMGLEKSLQGNVLRILTREQFNQEQQQRLERIQARKEAEESREQLAPLLTRYIQINYSTASQLEPQLQPFLSERGTLSPDARSNQLIIRDTAAAIQTVKNMVDQLDRPEQQVLIEARLVFVSDAFQRSMGIKWGGGVERTTGSHQFGFFGTAGEISSTPQTQNSGFAVNLPNEGPTTLGIGGFLSKLTGSDLYTLDAQLELGESQNQVQTISSPRVVTLNNVRAEMTQGTRIATQAESESGGTTTEYVDATLKLSVLPQITPDRKIILDLDISDDNPAGDDIETRSAQTKLMVDNEETIVIGGVQQLTERKDRGKIPGAGNIPLLGWLFKNKNIQNDKRELLIFIHPTILD